MKTAMKKMTFATLAAVGVLAIAPVKAQADNYVTSTTVTLTGGTWIVDGTVSVTVLHISVQGESDTVTLQLNEGATLNVRSGIFVSTGTLIIEGTGTLNVTGAKGQAGIDVNGTSLIVNGGTINASGSKVGNFLYGAAIGCAAGASGGSVTINGGRVTATGLDGTAGIGGDGVTVMLGWTEESDFIDTTGFKGTVGFAEGKKLYYDGTAEEVTVANLRGGRLVPVVGFRKPIVVADVENGSVTADKQLAVSGEAVTLTASCYYPFVPGPPTVVTATGAVVAVEEVNSTTYRFVMPDEDVVVTPVFTVFSIVVQTSEGSRNCVPIISELSSFDASYSEWYAVTNDVTLPERIGVAGNVKLYLCEGATLTCEKGVRVVGGNGLTIEGEGALVARAYPATGSEADSSAIGSDVRETCGNITIRSGTVTARGSSYGAAIGAGWVGNGGSVTIRGGKVTAIGGQSSPGIGSSYVATAANTAITLGWTEEDDFIECSRYNGPVSFVEGKEFLRADNLQIVPGASANGVRLIPKLGDAHPITVNSTGDGELSASAASAVKDATLSLSWATTNRYIIPATLTVKDGGGHDIAVGWTSPSSASFVMPDTNVTVNAVFADVGYVAVTTSDGTVRACRPITPHLGFADYGAGCYAVTEDTTIGGRVVIGGDALLYLCDGVTLTCGKGITVHDGSSLTIEGGGSLVADARGYNQGCAAGIGAGWEAASAGTITINGGRVTAFGGDYSAGIGGSSHGGAGVIAINGGQVAATGGKYADGGIGRGWVGTGGSVTLGWTHADDSIYASSYAADSIAFKENQFFLLQGTGTPATIGGIGGKTIVPYTGLHHTITENPGAYCSIDAVYADGTDPAVKMTEAPEGITVQVRCGVLGEYHYQQELTNLAVTASGGVAVPVTARGGGIFQFVMPAGDVTLTPQTWEIVYYDVNLVRDERSQFSYIQRGFNDSEPRAVPNMGTYDVRAEDTVRLDVRSIPPYCTTGITVTAVSGVNVPVTKIGDRRYEFVMPAENVIATILTDEIGTVVRNTSEGEQTCLALGPDVYILKSFVQAKNLFWFATTEDTTMRSTLQVEGDMHVKLYLSAGTTLICGGIYVPYGSTLTIEGEGTLISDATGAVFGDAPFYPLSDAGIGFGGNIIIKGGNITAKGAFHGPGIGGGMQGVASSGTGGYSGDVTILGGTVNAYGGKHAAGIGSGFRENCGVITISGGIVNAIGGAAAAGIGGGYAACGDIRISGGVVNATGGYEGAGIGGGSNGSGGTIAISGGIVNAKGGGSPNQDLSYGYGAGIGEGSYADPDNGTSTVIRITGGQVTARGGWQYDEFIGTVSHTYYSAGIGLGWKSRNSACAIMLGWTEGSDYVDSDLYYGDVTFAVGKFFKLDGTDTPATPGNINGVRIVPMQISYLDPTEDIPVIRLQGDYAVLNDETAALSDGWFVAAPGMTTISNRIEIIGSVNLLLCDGAELTASQGFHVAGANSLTIWAQSNDRATAGRLTVTTPPSCFAGIGGNDVQAGGVVTVNGGALDITGGYKSAGIGGGRSGAGGTTTINGGFVTARGGDWGTGIGGGMAINGNWTSGNAGTTTINGGEVAATGGRWCAAIGGAGGTDQENGSGGGTVVINGGTVEATGGSWSAAIGGGRYAGGVAVAIRGGTVTAAGNGAQAIGEGNGWNGAAGILTIDGMRVFASADAAEPVASANREDTCRSGWAKAEVCPHGGNGSSCPWCGAVLAYAAWAGANGVAGAWNAKDALGVHNVFRYAFDHPSGAFTDPPLLSISFDASGNPVVLTPPLVNGEGFDLSILATDTLDGDNPATYPLDPSGTNAIPASAAQSRFFRLKAEGQ